MNTPDVDRIGRSISAGLMPRRDTIERMRPDYDVRPRPARRGRPRVAFGIVVVSAMVATAVIAFSPDDTHTRRGLPHVATAEAALLQAGDAAAAQTWQPLGAGDFHHVMTTTVRASVPERPNDPRQKIDQMLGMLTPDSVETWTAIDGSGLTIRATGGDGDPTHYPDVIRDRSGEARGMSPTIDFRSPPRDAVASLKYADSVSVDQTFGRVFDGTSAQWYRTPKGFERMSYFDARKHPRPQLPPGYELPDVHDLRWGAKLEFIQRANEASPEARPAAIIAMLDAPTGQYRFEELGHVGQFGVTRQSAKEDARTTRAIKLLGSAPLSPAVRSDLFDWLAKRSTARLGGEKRDQLGREGTEIVFERTYERTLPARTVTVEQLRRDRERVTGFPVKGEILGPKVMRIKPDTQFRRWYASIIVDRATGELLESTAYGRVETTAQEPELRRNTLRATGGAPKKPWRVAFAVHRMGLADATLFVVRERGTSVTDARTAACDLEPAMCPK